ncbi:MAG: HesA/MoeB/ThiF family protein [Syntrophorhabdaceae bacterium]|nr:HesA/MoeB/ThiF family protein [Syntrophorhabdaceae bacterium]
MDYNKQAMISYREKGLSLNEREKIRYNRQIIYGDFGEEGQLKLKGSHVLIAGTGGLGSPNAINLVYAGIGKITVVDCDVVELSNLNRQSLHWEENINQEKVYSGAEKLKRMNPNVEVIPLHTRITDENVDGLIADCDLVIDCMDNMATRFIINEACVKRGIPFIFGGIRGLEGQITTIIPGKTPCLECIFPRGIEGKKPFPVFGATPAFIASLQSMEAIKLLAGFGELLAGRMLYFSGETMEFTIIKIEKKNECKICSGGKS